MKIEDYPPSKLKSIFLSILMELIFFVLFPSIILVIFDFLRSLMRYFDHLYIGLYTSKNYKKLIL